MIKNKTIKPLIKYRNKELRIQLLKLPHFWWFIFILLIALVLLFLSFLIFDYNNWLSSALVSTSCGCFTGLVFYFLSNIRNNKFAKLQKEYKQLQESFENINNILNTVRCYKFKGLYVGQKGIWMDRENIAIWLDELEFNRNHLPRKLYDVVPQKGYDPADRDNLNNYRERLFTSDEFDSIKNAMLYIYNELLPLADKLKELYREREDQLMLMGKHFF